MIQRGRQGCVLAALLLLTVAAAYARADAQEPVWWSQDTAGQHNVYLYFFWTETCPHCQRARPDIDRMAAELPWLEVREFNLTADVAHGRAYVALAKSIGQRAQSVPAFLFCGEMLTGYDNASGMGQTLRGRLLACKQTLDAGGQPLAAEAPKDGHTLLPGVGEVHLGRT